MINITDEVTDVFNKALKDHPEGGKYVDLGVVHLESTALILLLLSKFAEEIKIKYSLEYNTEELIKEFYETTA